MKYGSLFAGIGGIDLGLERAGMECAWQVEIDEYCQKVLNKHWPDVRRYKDVKEVHGYDTHANGEWRETSGDANAGDGHTLSEKESEYIRMGCRPDVSRKNGCPSCLEPVDLIAGGFPCQPHSVAGKRKGAEDDRNLWPEFSRIIRDLRPRYVFGENVSGIVTTYLDTVLSDLEDQGYTCTTFNIPACAFDAPHRRERIFIVAWYSRGGRHGEGCRSEQGVCEGTDLIATGVCETVADTKSQHRDVSYDNRRCKPKPPSESGNCTKEKRSISSWWTVEPNVGRVAHGIPSRVDRLRGLGNAVVPQVAEWIGRRIIEFDNKGDENV